jgi:hypothetical protein
MATRTALKAFFNKGDIPTEAQFASLIDSSPNITDDLAGLEEKIYIQDIVVSGVTQDVVVVPADNGYYFNISNIFAITISRTGTPSQSKYMQMYLNAQNQYIFDSGGYNGYIIGSAVTTKLIGANVILDLGYDLIAKCSELPTGVTACTIKVIIKGFKIAK